MVVIENLDNDKSNISVNADLIDNNIELEGGHNNESDSESLNSLITEDTEYNDDNDDNNDTVKNEESIHIASDSLTSFEGIGGGGRETVTNDIEYTIDYILEDDIKLINPDRVIEQVNIFIQNYKSPHMLKYRKAYNQLYQKYSNKHYKIIIKKINTSNSSSSKNYITDTMQLQSGIIHINVHTKIVVYKNDKLQTFVMELINPQYIYYNKNSNLQQFKLKISNSRRELLYKYENITSKISISAIEKQNFEKARMDFIELLETYYIYTLYHKKINNIRTTDKSTIILQKQIKFYKEKLDIDQTTLSGKIYSIDNSTIESLNKANSDRLIQYNNIIVNISGKSSNEIKKDKKNNELIKLYLNNNETIKITDNLKETSNNQDKYINYIVNLLQ